MSHSFNKIWIHAVWATKDRMPLIRPSAEEQIYNRIPQELRELSCRPHIVNGMPDHVHCLFVLNPQKSLSDVIKQIKGSSSHFVNQHNLIHDKFSWQTGYAAFSVSKSSVEKVFRYIENQKVHHEKRTYQEEVDRFLELYNATDPI